MVTGAGVKVADPLVVPRALMKYVAWAAVMVCAGRPAPVVKSVTETVAVQMAPARARSSVTSTVPSPASALAPASAAPRSAPAGTVMDSVPVMTSTVEMQAGSTLPGGCR